MLLSTASHSDGTAHLADGDGRQKSVVVADGHPLHRQGLRQLLATARGLLLCGEAGTLAEARRLTAELRPDLVLLDSELPDGDYLAFVEELRSRPDAPRVVVLCGRSDPGNTDADALRRGASAFVSKRTDGDELLRAICAALGGRTYLNSEMIDRMLRRRGRPGGNRT